MKKINQKIIAPIAGLVFVLSVSACAPASGGLESTNFITNPPSDSNDTASTPEQDPGTAPDPNLNVNHSAVKFHAFGDMNVNVNGDYSSHTPATVKSMIARDPAVILGMGDYIDGEKSSLSDSTYTRMWSVFTKKVSSLMDTAHVPFAPTPGNHDAYYAQERKIYSQHWKKNTPNVQYVDDSNYPFYYSFMREDVFFVSLDDANYAKLKNRTEQLTWLKKQLASDAAKKARARVVYGHIPLYSVVSSKANSSTVYQNGVLSGERKTNGSFTLEAILLESNVDLVLFGHSHGFYSGHYTYADGKKLRVVSLPCAGGSQRYLVGTSIKTPHGFVEVSIADTNELKVRYFNSAGVEQNLKSLPASITLDAKNRVVYKR